MKTTVITLLILVATSYAPPIAKPSYGMVDPRQDGCRASTDLNSVDDNPLDGILTALLDLVDGAIKILPGDNSTGDSDALSTGPATTKSPSTPWSASSVEKRVRINANLGSGITISLNLATPSEFIDSTTSDPTDSNTTTPNLNSPDLSYPTNDQSATKRGLLDDVVKPVVDLVTEITGGVHQCLVTYMMPSQRRRNVRHNRNFCCRVLRSDCDDE